MTSPAPATLHEPDLLPQGRLRRVGSRCLIFAQLPSTNALLLSQAADLPDGTVCLADHQTAGRGRLGRTWIDAPGRSLLLSILLREQSDSPLLSIAATLAAVCAADAVAATSGARVDLRWPNDLMLAGRKLGGVLAESTPLDGQRVLVLGIGMNVEQQATDFETALRERATSLRLAGHAVSRAALAANLLNNLDRRLAECAAPGGRAGLQRDWRSRCRELGEPISLLHDRQHFHGRLLDIALGGDLLVSLPCGEVRRFPAASTVRSP